MSKERFLEGFVAAAQIDAALLGRAGTTVIGREDRAGSGVVVCYWAGEHTVVWSDPELVEQLRHFEHQTRSTTASEAANGLAELGFTLAASADMRVLTGDPVRASRTPKGYNHRWLTMDESDVALVRAFADRSDPEEVEEAGLEDMDNFDEAAINVLTAAEDSAGDKLLAYGSACDWDWDPLFADIGVLVDPECRRDGLGRFVVANTTQRLITEGRLPLYRHGHDNLGSKGIAIGLGFETATTLAYFTSKN